MKHTNSCKIGGKSQITFWKGRKEERKKGKRFQVISSITNDKEN